MGSRLLCHPTSYRAGWERSRPEAKVETNRGTSWHWRYCLGRETGLQDGSVGSLPTALSVLFDLSLDHLVLFLMKWVARYPSGWRG